jgi:hypothetical protein
MHVTFETDDDELEAYGKMGELYAIVKMAGNEKVF